MDVKVSTKTKTVPAQNLLRYTSFLFAKTCIWKTKKKRSIELKEILKVMRSATKSKKDVY